jgi:hypothetical protein
MKFMLSKINTISNLHVAPQGNGLFKWEVLRFVKPLHRIEGKDPNGTINDSLTCFFMKAIEKHHSSLKNPKT